MEPRRNVNEEKNAETGMGVERKDGVQVEKEIVIKRSAQELYRFWRNLENLPRFMHHLKSVRDGQRIDVGFGACFVLPRETLDGSEADVITALTKAVEGSSRYWQSLPDSDVRNAGSVQFLPSGNNTLVRVVLRYDPPAGKVGEVVSKLLGENPGHEVEQDLQRLQSELERADSSARRAA